MSGRNAGYRRAVILFTVVLCWAGRAEADPILPKLSFGCNPDCSIVNQGDTFELIVGIEDVVDMYTFSFALTFDPAVVRVNDPTDITYSNIFTGPATYSPVPCDPDPNGPCAPPLFFGGSLIGSQAGFTGSGELARILFQAPGAGPSGLAFVNVMCDPDLDPLCDAFNPLFLNSVFAPILLAIDDGSVFVQATVPEPATIGLLGLGLLGLARRRFRTPR